MPKILRILIWLVVALLGALALATVALHRGEQINAMWLVVAAVCTYALGYRFYSKFIAAKVLTLDALRATPAERLENGRDFVPTNKWVVFGHHFAAIAGPGPLVGPVLAAQFGYLPGTLWILAGAVFGGCVQDFVILLFSVRRDGKSLTEMAREEVGRLGGLVAYVAVISIIVILLAVCALVVVNALKASPWGTFTIAMTIPIALLMGVYLRTLRPGKVLETSALGFVLVMLAIWGGQWVSQTPSLANWFTLSAPALAILIIVYGFAASALPVWLLLAPRDYLSTFVKLGTIALLALGIVALRPTLHMPALTRFIDGSGPVFAGNVFPFAFITIACGAISGFHALISSGTTPKLIRRETEARMVGYGAMMAESMVAVMAMIAACVLQPGIYFAINSPAGIVGQAPEAAATTISNWGFPVTAAEMHALAQSVGEQTLYNRTGGAPAFAVGMAHIFSQQPGWTGADGDLVSLRHHVRSSIHSDGSRCRNPRGPLHGAGCARPRMEAAGPHQLVPLDSRDQRADRWRLGIFSVAGSERSAGRDQFAVAPVWNRQPVAGNGRAVCGDHDHYQDGQRRYAPVTLVPLIWLVAITFTASWHKIFDPNPRIGFLSHAAQLASSPGANVRLIFPLTLTWCVYVLLCLLLLPIRHFLLLLLLPLLRLHSQCHSHYFLHLLHFLRLFPLLPHCIYFPPFAISAAHYHQPPTQ